MEAFLGCGDGGASAESSCCPGLPPPTDLGLPLGLLSGGAAKEWYLSCSSSCELVTGLSLLSPLLLLSFAFFGLDFSEGGDFRSLL